MRHRPANQVKTRLRFNSASWPLSKRSATAFGRSFASATGLASSLSGYVSLTGQRCLFRHRRRCGRFSRTLPRSRVLPGSNAPFVPPFGVFRLADPRCREPPESSAPCWCAVITVGPLGHCDSRMGRNRPALLHSTGGGFSSPLVAWVPFSRDCRRANAASGTGESCLRIRSLDCVFRGTGPTSLAQSFPGRPGLSVRCLGNFRSGPQSRSFNELR